MWAFTQGGTRSSLCPDVYAGQEAFRLLKKDLDYPWTGRAKNLNDRKLASILDESREDPAVADAARQSQGGEAACPGRLCDPF